jgi:aldehyde:ferredoxin oxidoreductase
MEQRYNGFWGRILRINLDDHSYVFEDLEPRLYRLYMGGRNLALHFLIREIPPGIDAFDRENKIALFTSVVTGTPIAGQGRHTAAALSPLTGGIADSQCGGWWGAEMKFTGIDGMIIEGKSAAPVYLLIEDDQVSFHSAGAFVGQVTGDVQDALRARHGDKIRVLQCGPAGEKLVRYANVTADLRNFHGRGGIGAVMGSKNLRAIAVQGSHRRLKFHDKEGIREIATWFSKSTRGHEAIELHHELGTPKGVVPVSVMGLLPTYNFQDGSFAGAEAISGETMNELLAGETETCYACVVACKRSIAGKIGNFEVSRRYGGPEYETIGLLGSNLGVDNIAAVGQANEVCNALGLDTISAGVTLSWAVESFERGLLTEADTGGIALDWNQPELYLELLEKIARRDGVGDLLAEGSRIAAQRVGGGSERYAIQVKGQELANHEPRGKWGVALGYAVSPTGADHLQAAHDPWFDKPGTSYDERETGWVDLGDLAPVGLFDPVPAEDLSGAKVRLFTYLQFIWGFHDVLDWCIFTAVPEFRAIRLNQIVQVIAAITGWETSLFEVMKAGERGLTMARAFNYLHGFSAQDDGLPERFFEPMRAGTLKGHKIDREAFDRALSLYYGMMGWDRDGRPTEAKLEELAVGWIHEKLDA